MPRSYARARPRSAPTVSAPKSSRDGGGRTTVGLVSFIASRWAHHCVPGSVMIEVMTLDGVSGVRQKTLRYLSLTSLTPPAVPVFNRNLSQLAQSR
jgi:hypothetical protein